MFYGYCYYVEANTKSQACLSLLENYFSEYIPETLMQNLDHEKLILDEFDIKIINEDDISYYFLTTTPIENYKIL